MNSLTRLERAILLAALAICFIMHVVDSINNWRP